MTTRMKLSLAAVACIMLAGCKSVDTQKIDDTLATLNRHGVVYSGTIEGPLNASVYAKTSFGAERGRWGMVAGASGGR